MNDPIDSLLRMSARFIIASALGCEINEIKSMDMEDLKGVIDQTKAIFEGWA